MAWFQIQIFSSPEVKQDRCDAIDKTTSRLTYDHIRQQETSLHGSKEQDQATGHAVL